MELDYLEVEEFTSELILNLNDSSKALEVCIASIAFPIHHGEDWFLWRGNENTKITIALVYKTYWIEEDIYTLYSSLFKDIIRISFHERALVLPFRTVENNTIVSGDFCWLWHISNGIDTMTMPLEYVDRVYKILKYSNIATYQAQLVKILSAFCVSCRNWFSSFKTTIE